MNSLREIKKMARIHPCGHGKIVRYGDENIIFSVVGNPDQNNGFRLYGDFEKTFEVAIFDAKTNNFITDYFYGEGEDVISFMSEKDLLNLTNKVFSRGFQFFPD